MKYALVYESGDRVAELAPAHFPAHQAWYREFQRRGELLMVGPFSDQSGALAVLTSRAAAEEFARGDPFVTSGLVRRWYIREWMEAIVPDAGPRDSPARADR